LLPSPLRFFLRALLVDGPSPFSEARLLLRSGELRDRFLLLRDGDLQLRRPIAPTAPHEPGEAPRALVTSGSQHY